MPNPILELEDLRQGTFNDPGVFDRLEYLDDLLGSAVPGNTNKVIKSDGTVLVASSITDDGTRTTFTKNSGTTALAPSIHMMELTNNADVCIAFRGTDVNAKGFIFANSLNANDGGIYYDTPGFARGLQLRTGGNSNRLTIDSVGATTITKATGAAAVLTVQTDDGGSHTNRPQLALTNTATGGGFAHRASILFNSRDAGDVVRTPEIRAEGGALSFLSANNLNIVLDAGGGTTTVQSSGNGPYLTIVPTGSTRTVNNTLLNAATSASFDTTSGALDSFGVQATVSSSRSAGGNILVNTAIYASAINGQVNRALRTDAGDVLLNNTSGNTTIGAGTSTNSTLNFNGRESVFSSAPSGLPTGTSLLALSRTGTFDTTSGALDSRGLNISCQSTRSAGANNLTNTAALLTASGAQVNVALRTDAGDVILNNTSGTTAIGTSPSSTRKLFVNGGAGVNAIRGQNGATGQTAANTAVEGVQTGSYDTTAGALDSLGVTGSATSTRSAGGNNLNNFGGLFTATGGQVNRALQTNDGDVRLNHISGTTYIGGNVGFNGTTPIAKPSVTGSRGGNAALANLLTALANYGLITDSTTA